MKIIVSKKARKKKKRDSFEEGYWKTIYPDEYVEKLISEEELEILKVASRKKQIRLIGTLKKTNDNFVYLDVPNNIINGLYSALPEDAEKPPYNNKDFNNVGAHISVIGSSEYEEKDIKDIEELGAEFKFSTGKIYSVEPDGWDEMKAVWFMSVDSPDLEKLRQKYGLSKLIDGHDFHISFAVKRK